jgi:F420-dependent oxidoreductase-like protein
MDFGYHTTSFVYRGEDDSKSVHESLVDRAQFLEDAGFSWFTIMDHFWQLPGIGYPDEPTIECYTGLSAVAEATEEMELSGLVTCVDYRHPAYLAKAMASLDSISEGRGVLGIGAGWFDDEYDAANIEFADPSTRIRKLRDAIRLCRTAWTEESPVDYEGEYYDLDGFYLDPKPDDVPVLVGGGGEQLTLRVTAEYADRWNIPGADPATYEHKLDVLREHCEDVGRDYGEIAKTVTVNALVRETTEEARDAYEELLAETPEGPPPREEFPGSVGTPAEVADHVQTFRELGVETYQIEVPKNDRETVERFADEVVPQF